MTVRRLLSTRDSMYVKLLLMLKYTRESTACLLNKRGPLKKRESLDKKWTACYICGPSSGIGPLVTHGSPSASATERNRLQVQRNATERNRPQVQRNGIVFKCNGTQRNGIVCKCNGTQRTEKIRLLWTLALILTCNDGRKGLVVINGTLIRSQRTTKVNDVQRHGNDEQQNGQRTMLFGRRMYAWELQADDDALRSNSSNACGRFRSVKGAHDGAGRLVGQPVRQWLPVGGATTELHCNTFGGRARRPSVTSQPWLSSSHGVAVDEW